MLDGLTIVDLAAGIAGAYCCKLLAELGATVIKVEDVRREDVPADDRVDGEPIDQRDGNWSFLHCNTNKLGVSLNPDAPAAAMFLDRLIALSHVVVIDPESMYWHVVAPFRASREESPETDGPTLVLVSP